MKIGGQPFTVIGVLASQGGIAFASVDDSIVVPLTAIEGTLVSYHPDISTIRVQADAGAVDTFSSAVESALRSEHGLATTDQNDFQIVNASSIASAVSSSTKTLTGLMAAIAAISLIVGGIGVANVMLVTVRERTREIGVRRAVGATRRDIVMEFLVYAVVTSIIGGVLGLGVGHRRRLHRRLGARRGAGVLGAHGDARPGRGRRGGHPGRSRPGGAGGLRGADHGAAVRVTGPGRGASGARGAP